jgi:hypothetical protein
MLSAPSGASSPISVPKITLKELLSTTINLPRGMVDGVAGVEEAVSFVLKPEYCD